MRFRTKAWARPELAACPYAVDDPEAQKGNWRGFFGNPGPIHLDLGCGKCTFLAEIAFQNPAVNYIGIDQSPDILGVARRNISARFGEAPVSNVALAVYNIEQLDRLFGEGEQAERIYINFCNPWPKSRDHKHRLTHTRQLELYKKILAPEGEIWFKTDNDDLFLSSQRYFQEAGFEIFDLTYDLNAQTESGNILSEHEIMFEARGIKTKALKARLPRRQD